MDELARHVVTTDAVPELLETFQRHVPGYSHLVLRTFEVQVGGEWRNAGWSLFACVSGESRPKTESVYRDVRMTCETKDVRDFQALIEDSWLRQQVRGVPSSDLSRSSAAIKALTLDNGSGQRPGLQWEISQQLTEQISFSRRLVNFNEPFHANHIAAYAAWFNLPDLRQGGDGRLGSVVVYLPETRAWISTLQQKDGGLEVGVTRGSLGTMPLRLKGHVGTYGEEQPIDMPASEGTVLVPAPVGSGSLQLFLVAEDGTILSWHCETGSFVNGRRRVFAAAPLESPEAGGPTIDEIIRLGECHTTEFKTFIDPDDRKKFGEVMRTICAFANTHGGTLLLGVEDDRVVSGVEDAVRAWASASLEDALRRFEQRLLRQVGERISPRPDIAVRVERIMDRTIVIVQVEATARRPVTCDDQVYIRAAGSTAKARGTEIQSMSATSAAAEKLGSSWASLL